MRGLINSPELIHFASCQLAASLDKSLPSNCTGLGPSYEKIGGCAWCQKRFWRSRGMSGQQD